MVRIEKDEIGIAYRLDKAAAPREALGRPLGHLGANKERALQYFTYLQCNDWIRNRMDGGDDVLEPIEYLGSQRPKIFTALKIVEVSFRNSCLAIASGQIATNSKATIFHEMPQQSKFDKVANPAEVLHLHHDRPQQWPNSHPV